MTNCPGGCTKHADEFGADTCGILNSAYVLAGFAMMLNIRLSYSSAPYALIRFKLPENLFSVFVRRMASALELWCLPSMLLANIIDLFQKCVFDNILFRIGAQTLKKEAGADKSKGLRGKALSLYEKANQLDTAVKKVDSEVDAAKVLKAKAGTSDSDPGKLRKLAIELYEKANKLKEAVTGTDGGKAQELATEVGANESSGLRDKLIELATAGDTGACVITSKANKVRSQYDTVKAAYDKVKNKNKANAYADKEALYDKVVDAWNAFNDVYKPEELLKEAVGDAGESTGLTKAFKELYEQGNGDLPGLAKDVKEQYSKVKHKFQLVQAQEAAYGAQGGSIKSTKYDKLKDAWDKFNDKYHDAISTEKFYITVIPSIVCQWLNFLTYVLLLVVYLMGGDQGHLTIFYFVIAISGVVFGINMTLVYAVDWQYITVYIAGENCFPILTSFIHYVTTLIFGNRRKWNSDFIVVCVDIVVAIVISFAAAVLWTLGYAVYVKGPGGSYGHIHAHGFSGLDAKPHMISPFMMIVVGMGLVYAIYPGIAPGMIVPFHLIDKIEMVLLIATIFPPMMVVILQKLAPNHSPKAYGGWGGVLSCWHLVDIMIVIKISLAVIFIYSIHYRESSISRAIVNQPKMSTFLSITFYMCHEFLLAIGFAGQVSNGAEYVLIPQYIGALFMIFLAFYSEGYIIEYKSHDPAQWPTTGMTKWNAFCFWCKRASKITNHNLRSLFTTDLRRDLVICHNEINFIIHVNINYIWTQIIIL